MNILQNLPKELTNKIFLYLDHPVASIYKNEIKKNKRHIIKLHELTTDYINFNNERKTFDFLDIEFCSIGLNSPTYHIQNAKAECFMMNHGFNRNIFYIDNDNKVAVDDRLFLRLDIYRRMLVDEDQHRAEELREIYIRTINRYKQSFKDRNS